MIAQKERQHENIAVEEDQEMQISVYYDVKPDHLITSCSITCLCNGVLIAFKDYKIAKGVWGSPCGSALNGSKFLADPYLETGEKYIILLNIYDFAVGFPAPILLALMLNEVTNAKFKRVIQTVSYLPHFHFYRGCLWYGNELPVSGRNHP